jgi:hypothetical protein
MMMIQEHRKLMIKRNQNQNLDFWRGKCFLII